MFKDIKIIHEALNSSYFLYFIYQKLWISMKVTNTLDKKWESIANTFGSDF